MNSYHKCIKEKKHCVVDELSPKSVSHFLFTVVVINSQTLLLNMLVSLLKEVCAMTHVKVQDLSEV